jgi:hypothetical protein
MAGMHRVSERIESGPFDYRLFGLRIRSDLELPELHPLEDGLDPDVVIRIDDGPGDKAQIRIDGIADFRVVAGNAIHVRPEPGASERNVRLYLLGSAIGMLLHQRGLLPLHANAVEIDGKALAFMGPSGSGKSTLAAWFHDRGYRVIADDVCVIRFHENGEPVVCAGLPRLRLWREALEASGRDPAQFDRSYAGADDWEKYDVPLAAQSASVAETGLAAIYLLERGETPEIEPLLGMRAAEPLFANTYRGQFVPAEGEARLHWEACLKLVRSTPIFRASRTWDLGRIDEQFEKILEHARQARASPA